MPGAGHYGIFSGSRWRKSVYPQVRDFILAHQPASATAASAAGHISSMSDDSLEVTTADAEEKTAGKTGDNDASAKNGRNTRRKA